MAERVSAAQVRRFMLLKQGLLGDYKFEGTEGIVQYIRQAGCIQFDPVDICGQNAQLVLHARVKRFRREQLAGLLYTERRLIDFFDKQLCIMPTEDWKYFKRFCRRYEERIRSHVEITAAEPEVTQKVRALGCACSKDLGLDEKVDWYWSPSKLSRATLEAMYYQGKLVIHHKQGTQNITVWPKICCRKQYIMPKTHIRMISPILNGG